MTQFLLNTKAGAKYYKLAIYRCTSQAIDMMIITFVGCTATVHWGSLSFFEKMVICLVCFSAGLKIVHAFLDTTMKELRGETDGDKVEVSTKTTITTPP